MGKGKTITGTQGAEMNCYQMFLTLLLSIAVMFALSSDARPQDKCESDGDCPPGTKCSNVLPEGTYKMCIKPPTGHDSLGDRSEKICTLKCTIDRIKHDFKKLFHHHHKEGKIVAKRISEQKKGHKTRIRFHKKLTYFF